MLFFDKLLKFDSIWLFFNRISIVYLSENQVRVLENNAIDIDIVEQLRSAHF